ncbi:CAMKK/META protein kinase [Pleurostoma richardsiae]|uniref:CAMKK/META protein kinase n=1 Tax=Pleurostoma richardsiae TaxID=41990 RepID=A0AA38VV14_9PEZI|nr:CAMKK/META protein kinase [Pleurostoma richardsiae]
MQASTIISTSAVAAPLTSESLPLDNEKNISTTSIRSSPGITVEHHDGPDCSRPDPPTEHLSAPEMQQYHSPMRQHRRTPSAHREIKETLNARSEYTNDDDDGRSHHTINQYVIKEEIGRGSYGAVHLAVDQFGHEFAIKEFSKARLRKRAQSNILRHGPRRPGRFPPGAGMDPSVSDRLSDQKASEARDALFLIREEIAIMKKLDHPNLVSLIEVLDDPEEDSLYMVLEMCKKGVIMKVGLDQAADPYEEEECRCWFRDLILGIEYLHHQGVVHRDIKPDNLLLTDDNVLKVVDFGVSEMFEKPEHMVTSKSAGSPAFLPPELCVAHHGNVSGTAADIWSMGVSLYCLRYGKIPFHGETVLEIYEAIKTQEVDLGEEASDDFKDLMERVLEKDPTKRIKMPELREHPWVTKGGTDPLLSEEENCSDRIEPPNALEVNHAFTRRMSHLLCVMKAISKFKGLLAPKTAKQGGPAPAREGGESPAKPSAKENVDEETSKSNAEQAQRLLEQRRRLLHHTSTSTSTSSRASSRGSGERGHAHDLTDLEPLYLGIGTGGGDDFATPEPAVSDVVSDSPTAVDFNVYDRAYEDEVERIRRQSRDARMYLTTPLEEKDRYRADTDVIAGSSSSLPTPRPEDDDKNRLIPRSEGGRRTTPSPGRFADLVASLSRRDSAQSGKEESVSLEKQP